MFLKLTYCFTSFASPQASVHQCSPQCYWVLFFFLLTYTVWHPLDIKPCTCSVGWGCKLRLLPCRRVRPPNECPHNDAKQPGREVPVMLELWRMRGTSSLPLLPGPLWFGVVALDKFLSMCRIELNCVLMLNSIIWNITVFIFKLHTYAKLNCLK